MTKPSKAWGRCVAKLSISSGLSILAMAVTLARINAQGPLNREIEWDREGAARYLDARIDLWFERASELKTGEEKTTCISCHTVVPYLLSRPVLRKAMHVEEPTVQEARLLREMAQRIETYPDHESMSDAKHGGERATEAVLNALIMARQDAFVKRTHLSPVTQKASNNCGRRKVLTGRGTG